MRPYEYIACRSPQQTQALGAPLGVPSFSLVSATSWFSLLIRVPSAAHCESALFAPRRFSQRYHLVAVVYFTLVSYSLDWSDYSVSGIIWLQPFSSGCSGLVQIAWLRPAQRAAEDASGGAAASRQA